MRLLPITPEQSAFFWAKVMSSGPGSCWLWQGCLGQTGYGRHGYRGSVVSAHRFSYFLTTGEDPGGLSVCHSCDNRDCVNPDHLWLGTSAENTADMLRKGRAGRARESRPVSGRLA